MRLNIGLVAVALFCVSSCEAVARPGYNSAAPVAYVVDMGSGIVLFEKAADKRIAPASMTKMMTAYVAFNHLARGEMKESDTFRVNPTTWKKWQNTGSSMFLKPGQDVPVRDLLSGMITISGNDAALVLAEGIGGSEAGFIKKMNATAARLGMTSSHFATVNGWPDGGKTQTTARDLAVLSARTIQDFPKLHDSYYGQQSFRWNNISQPNRNPLLGVIPGADGLKTGHTNEAGYCFAGSAKQKGRRVIMIVAGLPSSQARALESRRLMRWAFDAWRIDSLFRANVAVAKLPVQLGNQRTVAVGTRAPLALALSIEDSRNYQLVVRYKGPLKAPIERGAQIALLVAKFQDGTERKMPLYAATSVNRAGFLMRAFNGLRALTDLS
jgi:D-alanyl-D-alanine carboxypeptidase (penicillin-binding protein 5/6)